jgi:hypothetical protein
MECFPHCQSTFLVKNGRTIWKKTSSTDAKTAIESGKAHRQEPTAKDHKRPNYPCILHGISGITQHRKTSWSQHRVRDGVY